jgi:hypothetical protein
MKLKTTLVDIKKSLRFDLKSFYRVRNNYIFKQLVPLLYCFREIRKFVNIFCDPRDSEFNYLKEWLPRVRVSVRGIRWSSKFTSNRLWVILYIIVNLAFFLLISNVSHPRSFSIPVTISIGIGLWLRKQNRAAFLWTLSTLYLSFCVWGNGDLKRNSQIPILVSQLTCTSAVPSHPIVWKPC